MNKHFAPLTSQEITTVANVVQQLPKPSIRVDVKTQSMTGSDGSDIEVPSLQSKERSLGDILKEIPVPTQALDSSNMLIAGSQHKQFKLPDGKPFSFPEFFVVSLSGTKTPITAEQWEHIHELSFEELNLLDMMRDGVVSQYLNAHGHSDKTVCPECNMNDFHHAQGCSHQID